MQCPCFHNWDPRLKIEATSIVEIILINKKWDLSAVQGTSGKQAVRMCHSGSNITKWDALVICNCYYPMLIDPSQNARFSEMEISSGRAMGQALCQQG